MLPVMAEPAPLRLVEGYGRAFAGNLTGGAAVSPVDSIDNAIDRDFSRTLAALGSMAARSRIHALHPARPGDEGAATGFAFAVFAHLAVSASQGLGGRRHPRPILWVQDRRARLEAGLPYGLGLARLGIDPAQLIIISTKTALEALSATEIALEAGGLGGGLDGVLAELPPNLPADMLALGKRLALRAERSATPCLLLHASAQTVPAPVATRWQIASRPAIAGQAWAPPIPAVDLALTKNRFGATGRWSALLKPAAFPGVASGVTHVCVTNLPASLSQPVDAVSVDRSCATSARTQAA